MTVRGFYHTLDGDHVPATFSYDEEKRAFESALAKLSDHAKRLRDYARNLGPIGPRPSDPGKPFLVSDNFKYRADPHGRLFASRSEGEPLLTTLQVEQLNRNIELVLAIYSLNVCNIHSRSNMTMCIYTDYRWKAEKGWVRTHE